MSKRSLRAVFDRRGLRSKNKNNMMVQRNKIIEVSRSPKVGLPISGNLGVRKSVGLPISRNLEV